MTSYLSSFAKNAKSTPQREQIPGRTDQVKNSASGFVFKVDDWARLERFLVLGSEGGSFYATEGQLTKENAEVVMRCLQEDGIKTVAKIVAISGEGRAPKNDQAIFALAMASGLGDDETRKAALSSIPLVCRTGTHLFQFATFVEGFRGWGRGLRNGIAAWYEREDVDSLAYQMVKYRQRDKWTHRKLLLLSHPDAPTKAHKALYGWAAGNEDYDVADMPAIVEAFSFAQAAETPADTAKIVRQYRSLPREALKTDHLPSVEVWQAMLEGGMPIGAMVRNLANMTKNGTLADFSEATQRVVADLGNPEIVAKSRIHPMSLLVALKAYQSGRSEFSAQGWQPVSQIVDAIDKAFYLAFGNVEQNNSRTMLCLDVSGSMGQRDISGMKGITPRVASTAMAMITAATTPQHLIFGFAGDGRTWESTHLQRLAISPRQRLDDALKVVDQMRFGGTDCALPMIGALKEKIPVDTFVIYTDNETHSGAIHPVQALAQYRKEMGIDAKLIVVGMISNGFTIADPNDAGMLDVVGFDTATPNLMTAFAA